MSQKTDRITLAELTAFRTRYEWTRQRVAYETVREVAYEMDATRCEKRMWEIMRQYTQGKISREAYDRANAVSRIASDASRAVREKHQARAQGPRVAHGVRLDVCVQEVLKFALHESTDS